MARAAGREGWVPGRSGRLRERIGGQRGVGFQRGRRSLQKGKGNALMTPTDEQVDGAPEHVAWEYVSLLAAALQMTKGHLAPVNHQVQESFLVHVRNLAEFLCNGVEEFRKNPGTRPTRWQDNIFAVDLCSSVQWDDKRLDKDTKLRRAINKTLSHLTYSRDLISGISEIDTAFNGFLHAHGTTRLMRKTWDAFVLHSLLPQYEPALTSWVRKCARDMGVALSEFDARYDIAVRQLPQWQSNQTPDGPVS
jgi:hypothetical protein